MTSALPPGPALLLALLLALPAGAEPAPRAADMVAADLLPGWRDGGIHMAGLRLQLADQWKTYWRSPGEAGIPPVFDFSGSENLAAAEVVWPRPKLFTLNGLRTIGYAHEVVLPIRIRPRDPSQPVVLKAAVEMGVCRDICLPVTLAVSAVLPAGGARDGDIAAAIDRQPRSGAAAGLSALHCRVEPIRDGLRVTAVMDLPSQGGEELAVLETADPGVWVSEADTRRDGPRLTAVADLVPAAGEPFPLDRSRLRVTVLGRDGAVETTGCPG